MRYWEDYDSGEVVNFGAYRLETAEIVDFAARFGRDGGRAGVERPPEEIAPPMLVCSIFMRLLVAHLGDDSAAMGSPGVDSIDWYQTVCAGDVLAVEMELLSKRTMESRADLGLIKHRAVVRNQHGLRAAELVTQALFRRRAEPT